VFFKKKNTRNILIGMKYFYNTILFVLLTCSIASAQVSGKVWLDKDNDGIMDAAETGGISMVTIKAYWDNCAGVTGAATTTSDGVGAYSFAGIPAGAKVRLEFSTIPSGYSPSMAGASNGTVTQYTTAPSTSANFGLKQNCTPVPSNQIMQPGYSILTCLPGADNVVLAVKDIRQVGNLWDTPSNRNFDLSDFVPVKNMWTAADFGGNKLFALTLNPSDGTIYVGTSEIVGDAQHSGGQIMSVSIPTQIYKIGPVSTTPVLFATLPGNLGTGGLEFDPVNNQIFAVSLDNGTIYRLNATTGALLQTYDPLAADNGSALHIPPVGDAIWALGYNQVEKKLYYSVIENHLARGVSFQALNGNMNKIRSVQIDASGVIVPASDALEITIPFPNNSFLAGYSAAVADIEFNAAGTKVLLAESGIEQRLSDGAYFTAAHESRLLEYQKTGSTWNLEPIFGANLNSKYDIGNTIDYRGLNCRGGAAWGFHDATNNVINGDEEFVVTTADAIHLPLNAAPDPDWVYGYQITPSTGGNRENSAIVNLGNQAGAKYTFNDVEIFKGNNCATGIEIGNYVWLDSDKDGVQDPCENPMSNVKVNLKQGASIVATTTTNTNGQYLFGGQNNNGFSYESTATSAQTFTTQLTKNINDVRQNAVNVSSNAAGLLMNNRYFGLRFPFINIPKGATITAATLRFTASGAGNISNIVIKGDTNVDLPMFNFANTTDISTRFTTENTAASATWTNAATWVVGASGADQTTTDLSAIVQEVVNLGTWDRNKTLTFLLNAPANATGATAFDISGDATKGAILSISYTGTTQTTGAMLQTASPYTICIPLSQSPITTPSLVATTANSVINNGNDLNDSDGTINGANLEYAVTTPTEGANHTQDFGFRASCIAPILTALTNQAICEGAAFTTSNVTTSVTNGVTVNYQWYNDNGTNNPTTTAISGQTTSALTALPTTAGVYKYRVVANVPGDLTCFDEKTLTLTINALPTFTLSSTNVTCNGLNNGKITITTTSGATPFTFGTDDGVTFPYSSGTINGLAPASYKPAVKDANGCVKKCN
jgi:hypothetical protein